MIQYAIDCEIVGSGDKYLLIRVSVVRLDNDITVIDRYVKPTAPDTDFKTAVCEIKQSQIKGGKEFSIVRQEVENTIRGSILIGHSLRHILNVLNITHPFRLQRDLASYELVQLTRGNEEALLCLAKYYLSRSIKPEQHNSVDNAKAAAAVYRKISSIWERSY